jgi:hypothetical protein
MYTKSVFAVLLILLAFGLVVSALRIRPVEAIGNIYIRADGSVDPPTVPLTTADNVPYTFTDDIDRSQVSMTRIKR